MLDFGLSDAHQDTGGKSEIAPSYSRKTRRACATASKTLWALTSTVCSTPCGSRAGDLAGADRRDPENYYFVFY